MVIQDIYRGLSVWREDWPPNIIEFKKACIPTKLPPYYKTYETKALPPPVNRKLGRETLEKLKKHVNIKLYEQSLRDSEYTQKKLIILCRKKTKAMPMDYKWWFNLTQNQTILS